MRFCGYKCCSFPLAQKETVRLTGIIDDIEELGNLKTGTSPGLINVVFCVDRLVLWRVHYETVNLIPLGKHSWFESKTIHREY